MSRQLMTVIIYDNRSKLQCLGDELCLAEVAGRLSRAAYGRGRGESFAEPRLFAGGCGAGLGSGRVKRVQHHASGRCFPFY